MKTVRFVLALLLLIPLARAQLLEPSVGNVLTNVTQAPGSSTNDAANAGNLGETATGTAVTCTTTTGLSTGTAANIVTLTLSAGDWDVEGIAGLVPATTTTITSMQGAVSATSATVPATGNLGSWALTQPITASGTEIFAFPTGRIRVSLASSGSAFLVAKSVFATSTMGVCGNIWARRVR